MQLTSWFQPIQCAFITEFYCENLNEGLTLHTHNDVKTFGIYLSDTPTTIGD